MSADLETISVQIKANTDLAVAALLVLNDQLDELTQTMREFGHRAQQATPQLSKFGRTAKSSAVSMKLMRNANGLATSSFIRMSAKIGATVVALTALSNGIAKSIKLSNDYIENLNLFTVSMGPAAESARSFAEEVSELLGIDPSVWMRYQGVFNTIISGFGVATQKANLMSQQLTQLGYDISSFFNISVEDAMTKLQSGISGELEPLRRLGYDLSVARLQQEAYNLGIEKSVTQMTQAEKAQLRYYAIMTQVTASHTDMARTIESPANQMRVLQAQITMTARAIGELFIPILNKTLPYVIAFTKVVRRAAEAVAQLMGVSLPSVDYGDASSGFSDLTGDSEDMAGSFEDADDSAKELKKTILGFDEINALKDNSDSGKKKDDEDISGDFNVPLPTYDFLDGYLGSRANEIADKMIQKIKDLVNWVKNLGGGIDGLKKYVNAFKKGWDSAFDSSHLATIRSSLQSIKDSLHDIYSDPAVKEASQRFGERLAYTFGQIAGSFATIGLTIAANLLGGFSKFLEKHKDDIKKWMIDMFDISGEIAVIVGNIAEAIANIFSVFGDENGQRITASILGIFWGIFSGISEILGRVGRDLLQLVFQPIIDNQEKLKVAIDGILGVIASLLETIEEMVGYISEKVVKGYDAHVKPLVDSITAGLSTLVGEFLDVWTRVFQPILEGFAEKFEQLYQYHIKDMIDQIGEALGKVIDFLRILWERLLYPMLHWLITTALPKLGPVVEGAFSIVITLLEEAADVVTGLFEAFEGLVDFITGVFTGDWEKAWDGIEEIFSGVWSSIGETAEGSAENLKTVFGGMMDKIGTSANTWWESMKILFNNGLDTISSKVSSTWDSIKNFFKGGMDSIKSTASNIWDSVKSVFHNSIEYIKGLFNFKLEMPKIHFHLPKINFEWWDTGIGFSIPTNFTVDWNYYAKGGYFTGPTAGIIGEAGAEAVLPLTDRRAMASIANSIADAGGVASGSNGEYESMMLRVMQKALGNANLSVNVYSTLQTDDEAIARSASRGTAKLEYRYNPVG